MQAQTALFEYLLDGSTRNANVNGSGTPVVYKLQPPSGERYLIYRLTIEIEDASTGFDTETYGALAALSNGVQFGIYNANNDRIIKDFDTDNVKTNFGWARLASNVDTFEFGGGSTTAMFANINFEELGGPLELNDDQYLAVIINDDLTGLVQHEFVAKGVTVRD